MAQKPYKHNIEYIQKFYSHGSAARVVEFKPVYKETKPQPPKPEKAPVNVIHIDPVAFCGLMVAVVMLVVMLTGVIQFRMLCQDHAVLENHLMNLREESILLEHQYTAGYDLQQVEETALALGRIPVEQAKTISVRVQVPQPEPEPSFVDNILWFLSGLFA